ncbi:NmrA/HSCARG family protein [Mucilaginibacter aquariorum]|uniref:NmrA/HSCARG family protein n=1 Tax=Mucilaginibacter aquariorum TaxID=2967225 RepID=A0ABT1T930_9SPHI|nr:NmrA/HSCARG family protein [Mucilaginibacter aquariorum]MCQ6961119.1 NmrA/HSCARG family protein [Mucilaginibacter aquariorum]
MAIKNEDKPLITVVGVLGKQGLSAANSLIASGRYRVRGITRRTDADAARLLAEKGVELVNIPLDVGYEAAYRNAFRGSDGVFLLTPGIAPPDTHEFELGRQLADAAVAAGVHRAVFSGLENVEQITGGTKFAPHFTDKARIEAYIRTLPLKSAFIHMAFFYTNLPEFYTPVREGDTLVFPIYLPEEFRAPFVDPRTATGPAVLEIFDHFDQYEGRVLPVVGELITPAEMVATFSRVTGKKAVYRSAYQRDEFLEHFPDFRPNDLLVDEIIGMVEYAVEYGYFAPDRDLQWSGSVNPNTSTWEQFLRDTGWQGERRTF